MTTTWEAGQRAFIDQVRQRGPAYLETGTVVVVPSLSFSMAELAKITGVVYYEERLLFAILLLRQPALRMVYLTSLPVDPATVEYYLRFVPDPEGARRRLELLSLDDAEVRPLTKKLVMRPDMLDRISALAGGADHAHLMTFNVTPAEQALSEALGLPLYGSPPDLAWFGSKTGSRRTARNAGALVLQGSEDLWDLDSIAWAMESIRAHAPHAEAVVIKLNNGFAGQGNAIVDLAGPVRPLTETPTVFCALEENWPSFEGKIRAEGAIVEELVRKEEMVSPSVQLRIIPGQDVEIVSTHDQVLGGPEGQVYIGCRFPADPEYRLVIQEAALKVGRVLANYGVLGQFGIDFLVAPGRRGNAVYVSEINLRMGGTTHPFWMARLATGGQYDAATGDLITPLGPRFYVATDNLQVTALVGRSPRQVIDAIDAAGLGYDQSTCTGVTLHLLGALHEHGKMGVTCIAASLDEADARYEAVVATCTGL